ncbi:MAG: queuosine precursor transporter [Eubacteriales bacterium]
MSNEIILIFSLLCTFSAVLLFYKVLGKAGLFVWIGLATTLANIEVLVQVQAFGLEQTLGNILFASTFLATDILSEIYGKNEGRLGVKTGILSSGAFILISQSWFLYTPSGGDFAMPSMEVIFSNTPRLVIVSLVVYAFVQTIDVWLFDFLKEKTKGKNLWIRNNGSTMISQGLNAILFNFGAFYGVFETAILVDITIAAYAVYMVTSLLDTPFVYLAKNSFFQTISKKSLVI